MLVDVAVLCWTVVLEISRTNYYWESQCTSFTKFWIIRVRVRIRVLSFCE